MLARRLHRVVMNRAALDIDVPIQEAPVCRVCGGPSTLIGKKRGKWDRSPYLLAACARCGFRFVVNPNIDFAGIYDEKYYRGEGADPLANYVGII